MIPLIMARLAFVAVLAASSLLLSVPASAADAEPSAPPTPAPDARSLFAGSFRYAGDSAEGANRRAAIDRAIESLFFAIRGIARSRLTKGTEINTTVAIAFEGGKIRIKVPGAPEAISPENGAAVDYTATEGEKSKLTQKLVGGTLVQSFQAEEGRRENHWTVSGDGKTLLLKVIISSPKLTTPCVFTLTYKR